MNLSEVKKIFLEDDILPLGNFESLPVICEKDGEADSYPNVSLISENIDYITLTNEAKIHIEKIGPKYVKERLTKINKKINEEVLRDILADAGFYKGIYQSYSLRKLGTSEIEDWVLPKTRSFFNSLNVKTFRQQYAVAFPGWNTKLHRDHKNFKTHGFRAMVPLNSDVYMAYEDCNKNMLIYKLKRGGMYFVNIAKMHRGFNDSLTEKRINLIMQMDSDFLVNRSAEVKPMTTDDINKLPEYAVKYDIWRFGYELQHD
jgi:hypothetical protein